MDVTAKGVFFTHEEIENEKPEDLILKARATKVFFEEYVNLWSNGSYFTYKNDKTKSMGSSFFIRINNDGSEDLVELHYNEKASWFTTIEQVTPPGEAKAWKETIERGFMDPKDIPNFIQKPRDRVLYYK